MTKKSKKKSKNKVPLEPKHQTLNPKTDSQDVKVESKEVKELNDIKEKLKNIGDQESMLIDKYHKDFMAKIDLNKDKRGLLFVCVDVDDRKISINFINSDSDSFKKMFGDDDARCVRDLVSGYDINKNYLVLIDLGQGSNIIHTISKI